MSCPWDTPVIPSITQRQQHPRARTEPGGDGSPSAADWPSQPSSPSPCLSPQGQPREDISVRKEHDGILRAAAWTASTSPLWSYCGFLVAAGSPFQYLRNPLRDLTSPFLSFFLLFFSFSKTISLARALCNTSINTSCGSKLKGNRNNYAGIRSLKL